VCPSSRHIAPRRSARSPVAAGTGPGLPGGRSAYRRRALPGWYSTRASCPCSVRLVCRHPAALYTMPGVTIPKRRPPSVRVLPREPCWNRVIHAAKHEQGARLAYRLGHVLSSNRVQSEGALVSDPLADFGAPCDVSRGGDGMATTPTRGRGWRVLAVIVGVPIALAARARADCTHSCVRALFTSFTSA
jgi:hypothetical protein